MIKLNGYQIVLTHPTVCVKVKTTPTRSKFSSLGMVSISIIYFAPFTRTAQSASMTGKLYFFIFISVPLARTAQSASMTSDDNSLIIFILATLARTAQSASMTGNWRGSILLSPNKR